MIERMRRRILNRRGKRKREKRKQENENNNYLYTKVIDCPYQGFLSRKRFLDP